MIYYKNKQTRFLYQGWFFLVQSRNLVPTPPGVALAMHRPVSLPLPLHQSCSEVGSSYLLLGRLPVGCISSSVCQFPGWRGLAAFRKSSLQEEVNYRTYSQGSWWIKIFKTCVWDLAQCQGTENWLAVITVPLVVKLGVAAINSALELSILPQESFL